MRSLAGPCVSRRRGLGAVSCKGTEDVEKTEETGAKGADKCTDLLYKNFNLLIRELNYKRSVSFENDL